MNTKYKDLIEQTFEFPQEEFETRDNHLLFHGIDLMALIKRLGNEIGAKQRYFTRNEKSAQALPPEWSKLQANERKLHVAYQHNLRLYCIRLSDEVVILFNGGVKTPGRITAQECKVVRQYFYMANKLCQTIDQALRNKEIKLNGLKLEIPTDFELIL